MVLFGEDYAQKGDNGMKVCFPTETLLGLDSEVYGHFGSAPGFVVIDTGTMSVEEINNNDLHHVHGMCQPLKALGGHEVDAVVVVDIGMGALMRLQAQGILVYRGMQGTVRQNVDLIQSKKLPQFRAENACSGHTDGGCAHSL
jgi:predicted Fe-Mo cluster-binding NifX family protein